MSSHSLNSFSKVNQLRSFVKKQLKKTEKNLTGHKNKIFCMKYCNHLGLLVSGSADHVIRGYDVKKGATTPSMKFTGHNGAILCMELDPVGTKLFTGSRDSTIKIWDLYTAKKNNEYPLETMSEHRSPIYCLKIDITGRFLYSGSENGNIIFWDLTFNGQPAVAVKTIKAHNKSILALEIDFERHYLYSGAGDSLIKIWNLMNISNEEVIPLKILKGHKSAVSCFLIDPLRQVMYSGSYDKTIKVWNLIFDLRDLDKPWVPIRSLNEHSEPVSSLQMSRTGKYLYSGSFDNKINVWDIECELEDPVFELIGHKSIVRDLECHLERNILYSCGDDEVIKVWDLEIRRCNVKLETDSFGLENGKILDIEFDGRRKYMFTAGDDGKIKMWNILNSNSTPSFCFLGHLDAVTCLRYDSWNQKLYSGSIDGNIHCYDVKNKKEKPIKIFSGHKDQITCLKIEERRRLLFTSSWDKTIFQWNLKTEETDPDKIFKGHKDGVTCIEIDKKSPLLYSGSNDNMIGVWSTKADEITCIRMLKGHKEGVVSILIDSSSQFLFSCSIDCTIRAWDLKKTGDEDREPIRIFRGHTKPVISIGLSWEGKVLYSASHDNSIKCWNLLKETNLDQEPIDEINVTDSTINLLRLDPTKQYIFISKENGGIQTIKLTKSVSILRLISRNYIILRSMKSLLSFESKEKRSKYANYLWQYLYDNYDPKVLLHSSIIELFALAGAEDILPKIFQSIGVPQDRDFIKNLLDVIEGVMKREKSNKVYAHNGFGDQSTGQNILEDGERESELVNTNEAKKKKVIKDKNKTSSKNMVDFGNSTNMSYLYSGIKINKKSKNAIYIFRERIKSNCKNSIKAILYFLCDHYEIKPYMEDLTIHRIISSIKGKSCRAFLLKFFRKKIRNIRGEARSSNNQTISFKHPIGLSADLYKRLLRKREFSQLEDLLLFNTRFKFSIKNGSLCSRNLFIQILKMKESHRGNFDWLISMKWRKISIVLWTNFALTAILSFGFTYSVYILNPGLWVIIIVYILIIYFSTYEIIRAWNNKPYFYDIKNWIDFITLILAFGLQIINQGVDKKIDENLVLAFANYATVIGINIRSIRYLTGVSTKMRFNIDFIRNIVSEMVGFFFVFMIFYFVYSFTLVSKERFVQNYDYNIMERPILQAFANGFLETQEWGFWDWTIFIILSFILIYIIGNFATAIIVYSYFQFSESRDNSHRTTKLQIIIELDKFMSVFSRQYRKEGFLKEDHDFFYYQVLEKDIKKTESQKIQEIVENIKDEVKNEISQVKDDISIKIDALTNLVQDLQKKMDKQEINSVHQVSKYKNNSNTRSNDSMEEL